MSSFDADRVQALQEVSLDDFPKLDRAFYLEVTRFFEGEQFSHAGDLENLAETRNHPSRRTCLRILLASDGETLAAVYQIPTAGFTSILRLATPLKFVELETEFTDGEFIATTNNGLGDYNPHVDKDVEMQATPEQLLERHRQRVREYLEDHPEAQVRILSSLGDAIEAQQRQQLLSSSPARDRPRGRARTRRRQGSGILQGPLQDVDRYRAAVSGILAILLISLVCGYFAQRFAIDDPEAVPELTQEQLEQAYEETREMRSPSGVLFFRAALLAAVVVLCLIYELLRRGFQTGLVKLLGLRGQEGPVPGTTSPRRGADGTSPRRGADGTSPRRGAGGTSSWRGSGARPSVRPATIGKIVFIAGTSLMLGLYMANRATALSEAAERPTLEEYRDGLESRQEAIRYAADRGHYFFYGVFFCGAFLSLYELAGALVAVGVALSTGGTVSFGVHLFVSSFGALVLFAFSLVVFSRALSWFEWHWGEASWSSVAMLIWIIAVQVTAGWILEAIPIDCSQCDGKADRTSVNPIVFECRECHHKQKR